MRKLPAILLACALACSGERTSGPPAGPDPQVNTYLQGLPSWAQFSPRGADQDPGPTAAPALEFDTIPEVRSVDQAGTVQVDSSVPYVCEVTPYSVQRTPRDIVMYSPNASILWPGAFIQGVSHRDGLGSLLPLVIAERAPVNISIPAIQTGTNFRRVDVVDQAHVAGAIGDIIGAATENGLQTSSSIFFYMDTYDSQREFGLSFNVSGRYLGFEGAVGGAIAHNASQSTISAHFYQKMFTVVVSPPSTPGGWFANAFTNDKLQQQVSLGRIGPDNLPVYLGEVVYGRMMMFSITSTASETELRAIVNASYQNLTGQASGGLSTRQKTILSESQISITSIGGNDQATIAMIRSGDWSAYFTASAPLSTAEPLSYTFYNLGDNSVASVTEATSYNVRTCAQAGVGQFDFLPAQSISAPLPVPFQTRLGDVNGDGRADLVFNHLDATSNVVAVGLGNADGSFTIGAAASHPVQAPEGWANYELHTGDVNGDGRMDLLWTHLGGSRQASDTVNRTFVATADAAGAFTFQPGQQHPVYLWPDYKTVVGDLDGDGDDDIVWDHLSTDANVVWVGLSNGDGTFDLGVPAKNFGSAGWSAYQPFLADINRDGRKDLLWNSIATVNRSYTAQSLGGGAFGAMSGPYDHPIGGGWTGYQTLVADVSQDQVPDLVWYLGTSSYSYLHRALGTGTGSFSFQAGQDLEPATGLGPFTAVTGDVNGDGAADLILNRLTSTSNVLAVGRGTAAGTVDATVDGPQTHPVSTNWSGALPVLVGDVNGDGREDVVWVLPGSPSRIYVAQSRSG